MKDKEVRQKLREAHLPDLGSRQARPPAPRCISRADVVGLSAQTWACAQRSLLRLRLQTLSYSG